jgi:hypothetical protein
MDGMLDTIRRWAGVAAGGVTLAAIAATPFVATVLAS